MHILDELRARDDLSASARGLEFERLCVWFLTNDPVYSSQISEVWLWNDWPGRWGPDSGIDLVAKTKTGELWAVQAKLYAPEHTVSKADIDSFLAESSRDGFVFRLLIATTDRLSNNAKRTLAGQKVPAQALLRSHLLNRDLDWPTRLGEEPKPRRPFAPRPHQNRAIRDVVKGFNESERGQLIMACGTGKTLTSLFIAERVKAGRVLVLVPSLSLLSQTLAAWTANATDALQFLAVCSDETVAENDAPVDSTSDLGLPVTTNPEQIAKFLRRRGETLRVVFATYQSSERIQQAQALTRVPKFDLAIADEAHRCAGSVTSNFAIILDSSKIRATRRLFMTATPRILSARVKRSAADDGIEFASMDDENTFGPVFHRLTFARAIAEDLLADYQVVILGVDNEEILRAIQQRQLVTTDGKDVISADRLGSAVGLAKAIRRYGLTRIITFHGRVKAASTFAANIPDIIDWMPAGQRPKGVTEATFVSGHMSAGDRNRALNRLKSSDADQVILANARILTEGIDVPDLDGIAFMDPRTSEVDIVQAVGRAIRKPAGRGKAKIGTVVVPIVIKQLGDADAELSRSDYRIIWGVLRALRAHDERLAEELDALRRQLGRTQRHQPQIPERILVSLPRRAGAEFTSAISSHLVRSVSSSWDEVFGHLEAFVAEHGHARPGREVLVQGHALAAWISEQRKNRGTLSTERCGRLEALPGWTWDPRGDAWETGFEFLVAFVAKYGHSQPRIDWDEAGYPLGSWVRNQRRERGAQSPERRERLEALPGWTWDLLDARWEEGFRNLEAFAVQSGHARPVEDFEFCGYPIGRWVKTQRRSRFSLLPERRQRLESLPGWAWSPHEARWEEGFSRLQGFAREHGHSRPKGGDEWNGFPVGQWAKVQRRNRISMSDSRRNRLEELPGWTWNTLDSRWDEGYGHLEDFVAREGHARPPRAFVSDGYPLGQWISEQRRSRNELSAARRRRLESLPGWAWSVRT